MEDKTQDNKQETTTKDSAEKLFALSSIEALDIRLTSMKGILKLARIAEESKRFVDMCVLMKQIVALKPSLNVEERNLFSVAFKNVVGSLRVAWRKIGEELEVAPEGPERDDLKSYLQVIETELKNTCDDILSVIEKTIVPSLNLQDHEPLVFFLKMAGDYYRYMAEAKLGSGEKSVKLYSEAFAIAEKHLEETHPTRLGLVLNYSVCIYEISGKPADACRLAKTAFESAISKLDSLDESTYKDSTLILQLMRDNITLWTSDEDNNISMAMGETEEPSEDEDEEMKAEETGLKLATVSEMKEEL